MPNMATNSEIISTLNNTVTALARLNELVEGQAKLIDRQGELIDGLLDRSMRLAEVEVELRERLNALEAR